MNTIAKVTPKPTTITNNSLSALNSISTVFNKDNQVVIDITKKELESILKAYNPTSGLISLLYYSDFKQSRTVNKVKVLKKLSYQRVFIGHNYQNKVDARLKEEAILKGEKIEDFKAKKANGLKKLSNVLFENKYQQLRLRTYLGHEKIGNTEKVSTSKSLGYYTQNNETISFKNAKEQNLFTPSFFNKKVYTAGQGKLTDNFNNFRVKNFKIESILAIAINGNIYRIVI